MLDREERVLGTELKALQAYLAELSRAERPTDPQARGLDLRARLLDAMLGWIAEARRRVESA